MAGFSSAFMALITSSHVGEKAKRISARSSGEKCTRIMLLQCQIKGFQRASEPACCDCEVELTQAAG